MPYEFALDKTPPPKDNTDVPSIRQREEFKGPLPAASGTVSSSYSRNENHPLTTRGQIGQALFKIIPAGENKANDIISSPSKAFDREKVLNLVASNTISPRKGLNELLGGLLAKLRTDLEGIRFMAIHEGRETTFIIYKVNSLTELRIAWEDSEGRKRTMSITPHGLIAMNSSLKSNFPPQSFSPLFPAWVYRDNS